MITGSLTYVVALYLRLSKDDDLNDESLSISNQRMIIKDYIERNFPSDTIIKEYADDGFTGMNAIRPGLNQLLNDLQDKKVNCIIVKDISRLARKNSLISYYADELFYEENIRLISILENFDNTIDADTEKLMMPGFFNEFHVRTTSKKVKATKERQAKNGLFTGGFAPYGYFKDEHDKHKLIIDPYASSIVKYIFKEFLAGKGLQNICYDLMDKDVKIPSIYKNMNRGLKSAHFGLWTTKTLSDMLHNPTYAGHLTQHKSRAKNISSKHKVKRKKEEWIIAYNTCPAIVDQESFDKVQDIWEKNKRRSKKSYEHLLTGFIYCKECGHTIGITRSKYQRKNGEIVEKFFCNCNYFKSNSKYHACTPHRISYDELEENILNEVIKVCKNYIKTESLEDILKDNDKTKSLKKEIGININLKDINIKTVKDKCNNLYDDKLSGFIDSQTYLKFKAKYDKEIDVLLKEKKDLEDKLQQIEKRIRGEDSKYMKVINEFLSMKKIDRNMLFDLVDRIEIDEEKNIEIKYKIKPPLEEIKL